MSVFCDYYPGGNDRWGSSKKGATAAMIQTAITNNYGGMGQFSSFTAEQIQAPATALSAT
jgi:hypothetical protein